jgi:hypothetical protein
MHGVSDIYASSIRIYQRHVDNARFGGSSFHDCLILEQKPLPAVQIGILFYTGSNAQSET